MSPSKKPAPTSRPARRTPASREQAPAEGLALGLADVQALITQVGREPIDEFQFESLGVKLHIRKLGQEPRGASAPAQAALPAAAGPVHTLVATALPAPERGEDPGVHHITSPIVGTFYRAPSATSAPFVQPGDFVKPGQTLCIVEAMKLMNEIECDVAGEVVAVLVENGQPVEYGERLFAIRVR
ncbi:MAG: acetyl-CoA carboxylase biotin carboxyl carrier protein [Holophaga sp.]